MDYCTHIPESKIPAVPRIIVIGDIHGDWRALKSALTVAGVTNYHNDWLGGDTHVVQVGDLVDRAVRGGSGDERSESRIINHLIDLKHKAQRAGGDVHLLLGNHEIMNVYGDFRYVSPMGYTDFNGKRKEQFRPGGKIAKLLACNASTAVQIGSWVFSHAGVTPEISDKYTIEDVNEQIRTFLLGKKHMNRDHPIMDIFWHRNYTAPNSKQCTAASRGLRRWKARNMAFGHTVQNHGISNTCNETLWKVDVGMSSAFDGKKIEVLEILDDGDTINVIRGKKCISC